jgi:hypothetical protein
MWPDENGDWGASSWDRTAGAVGSGSASESNSIIATSAAPSDGSGQWTGWLQGLVNTGVSYYMAKDAAQSGMVQATAPNGQPIYAPAGTLPAVGGLSNGALLLLGAAIVGAVLIAKR